jgi:hypothetical protein
MVRLSLLESASLLTDNQKTLDKKILGKVFFFECFIFNSRQIVSLESVFYTRQRTYLPSFYIFYIYMLSSHYIMQ